jgi:hypothetical protein
MNFLVSILDISPLTLLVRPPLNSYYDVTGIILQFSYHVTANILNIV